MMKYVLILIGAYVIYYLTIMIMDSSKRKSKLLDSDNSLGSFDLTGVQAERVPINVEDFEDKESSQKKSFETLAENDFNSNEDSEEAEGGYKPIPEIELNPLDEALEEHIEASNENKKRAKETIEENNTTYSRLKKFGNDISHKAFYAFDKHNLFDFDINLQLESSKKITVFFP